MTIPYENARQMVRRWTTLSSAYESAEYRFKEGIDAVGLFLALTARARAGAGDVT